jgi:4-hydroxybenzoate polyprenyltransferase
MTMVAQQHPAGVFFRDIKIVHTVFALPFALLASAIAFRNSSTNLGQLGLIIAAMFGARTWAMSINRLADAPFDRANPRTAGRALPSGQLSKRQVWVYALVAAALFIGSAALLSGAALACALPVLAILASYSFAKRLTWLCHFWLGACLGLAPIGAWVALVGTFEPGIAVLGLAITTWVGGFDILYALQDLEFDRDTRLHSVPARFGVRTARALAAASHTLALVLFAFAGMLLSLTSIYQSGVAIAAVLVLGQHVLVAWRGLAAVPFAFFQLNGWLAVVLCVSGWIGTRWHP